MATVFSDPDEKLLRLLDSAMSRWHGALKTVGVQIGVIMASNPDGPAVKHGGYPAAATIKVVNPKDRLKKKYDAELVVDESVWADLSDKSKLALLDHELSHLTLIPNKPKKGEDDNGSPWKFDDLGRPKLRTVKGTWNAGDGFASVVERHGEGAIEFLSFYRCFAAVKALVDDGVIQKDYN